MLRRHWHPIWPAAQPPPGRARPVRALGEDYTLYRGASGKVYLTESHCPHCRTVLSAGWVEGDNLRCCYHGWCFDPTGQCVDQPAEDPAYARGVRIRT